MKNLSGSICWTVVGVAAASVAIVVAYKMINSGKYPIKKVSVKELSYEWLLEEAKKMVMDLVSTIDLKGRLLHLSVLPNQLAKNFCSSKEGMHFLKKINLTEEEMEKMIILSIHDDQHVLSTEIIITEEFCDDYYDYIQKDKAYIKRMKIDSYVD